MKPTQEQVIAWAREAGFRTDPEGEVLEGDGWHIQTDIVERFAALAYEAGRKDENEACVEAIKPNATPMEIAATIRARREQ